jgi:outer membrane receptor protein involved in Fe transport
MFRKKALGQALALAFAAASLGSMHSAYAQSSTGSVRGHAAAGTVVTIENQEIGLNRTVSVGNDGNYQVTQLPPGTYTVRAKLPGGGTEENTVIVAAGQGASADFSATARVVVTGRATRIDVSSSEVSTVLNKATLEKIPVRRDVTAVALLAPTATQGDSRIGQTSLRGGNVPSLGGASPAENVYYINGFNVTNMLNGVAFNQVPFDAIAQEEIKTGGYGPEYGRSLGGVMSVTTKRGTNEWHGGANVIYSPKSLAGKQVYPEKSPSTGNWMLSQRDGGTDDLTSNIWLGGPAIKDKLFLFGLVQLADVEQTIYSSTYQQVIKSTTPRYLFKADWKINDWNQLELTAFSDKSKDKAHSWDSLTKYGTAKGDDKGVDTYTNGGENYIAKYTSWLTDDFTVSALAGLGRYNRKSDIPSSNCPYVADARTDTTLYYGCWTSSRITDPNANDERKAYRIDAEWKLGSHGLRFGMDNEKYKVVDGTFASGKTYNTITTLDVNSKLANGYVNTTGGPIDVVTVRTFANGGTFSTKNSAFYVADDWQITKNVLLNLGVRSESFENFNAEEKTFIKVSNTIAPRLGVTWDAMGDKSLKLYSTLGRYYIPVMSNTNVRLAGAETDYRDYFQWNGTFGADKFEVPGHGTQLGSRLMVHDGHASDPRSVVDPNIKPMYQDEFIIGAEKAFANRWTLGTKWTHRVLQSVMDDVCNGDGAMAWANSVGMDPAKAKKLAGAVDNCFLFNPGKDLTANIDYGDGKGYTATTVPAKFLGFPKAERLFDAVEFTFNRAWDGVWMLQGSYVWSHSRGNTEGYVKSDIGQDDAGISQDWDFPGLMEGSYGDLPNDRRHTFKLFGAYQVTPELRVGANLLVQSGRPVNCLGFYNGTADEASIEYEAASFYCGGDPLKPGTGLHPRGSFGRLDWTKELGVQVTYQPKSLKGTTFSVDVLNVFNERTVRSVQEEGETGIGSPDPQWRQPIGIQNPRTIRFTAQYEF